MESKSKSVTMNRPMLHPIPIIKVMKLGKTVVV